MSPYRQPFGGSHVLFITEDTDGGVWVLELQNTRTDIDFEASLRDGCWFDVKFSGRGDATYYASMAAWAKARAEQARAMAQAERTVIDLPDRRELEP